MAVEVDLAGRLASTARRRRAEGELIRRLAARADQVALADLLAAQGLLAPLGTRLAQEAPECVTAAFLTHVCQAATYARRRAVLTERVTLDLLGRLADAGIPAMPVKGPLFAERIFGDTGMRLSNDIDILVPPAVFHDAARVISGASYEPLAGRARIALPVFESSLRPRKSWLPPVDLHWRLHWYESEFSRCLMRRSSPGENGVPVPASADELAALLLFYARDGFWGLRGALDIAAWWDVWGDRSACPLLDPIVVAHPQLRPVLVGAALVAERSAGVPASALVSGTAAAPPGARWAVRQHERVGGPRRQSTANVMVVDWLLTPPGGRRAYVRRHLLKGPADLATLPAEARLWRLMRRLSYACSVWSNLLGGAVRAVLRGRHRSRSTLG